MREKQQTVSRRTIIKATSALGAGGMAGLAGCSGSQGDGTPSNGDGGTQNGQSSDDGQIELSLDSGIQGSAPFQLSLTFAEELRRQSDRDLSISVQSSGGLDSAVRNVANGNVDLCNTTGRNIYGAATGAEPFQQEHDVRPLLTVASFPGLFAVTTTDSDISTINDFPGNTVVTGPPGAAMHTAVLAYMKVNGLDPNEVDFRRVQRSEGRRQMDQGRVDAVMSAQVNNIIASGTREWVMSNDNAKLVPMGSQEQVERYQFGHRHADDVNPAGLIDFEFDLTVWEHAWENSVISDQETMTVVTSPATYVASPAMSHEVGKRLVELTVQNRESFGEASALWAEFANEPGKLDAQLPQYVTEEAPWHPGAAEALQEAGVWNDDQPIAE
jgi:TRAP-type uncharacterized transport system substrate-binding protein